MCARLCATGPLPPHLLDLAGCIEPSTARLGSACYQQFQCYCYNFATVNVTYSYFHICYHRMLHPEAKSRLPSVAFSMLAYTHHASHMWLVGTCHARQQPIYWLHLCICCALCISKAYLCYGHHEILVSSSASPYGPKASHKVGSNNRLPQVHLIPMCLGCVCMAFDVHAACTVGQFAMCIRKPAVRQ